MYNGKYRLIVMFLIGLIAVSQTSVFSSHSLNTPPEKHPANDAHNAWYTSPQVYNMGAFSTEDIEKYHITVNGLWNGFIGDNLSSPFAFGRLLEYVFSGKMYESDKAFVDAQHAQGVKVPATILTTQGHRSFQEDDFEGFACRSVNGELCFWDESSDSYWMNANNPGFINWCIEHGKKAIDAGADMIVLDEIQGNGLIPLYQWSSQYTGLPAPGFSKQTIAAFQSYLLEKYTVDELRSLFNISSIESYDFCSRIAATMNLTYEDRITVDPLIKEYCVFLEVSNFDAKKHLIESLRTYADEKDSDIVITANSYALGTNQPMGFWPIGLHFADLIDMFTFENTYTVFVDKPIPDFYRTKWLAWERLAYASTDAPAVILIDTSTLEAINDKIFPFFGFSHSLGILCAEAYANKGSFVNYHFPFYNREKNWGSCQDIQGFVMDNTEVFEYSSKIFTDVGIVFLYGEGMRQHMNTYLGCAQALAESQIPFEVVFDGDGFYLDSSLCLDDLERFSLIVVPSLLSVTEQQKQVIKDFVSSGGIAIVFDAGELGFLDDVGELSYGNGLFYFFDQDCGKMYFENYDNSYRQSLADCVRRYVSDVLLVNKDGRRIVVTPYLQDENNRVILHMINYDHIGFFDFIWPQSDIEVHVKRPSFTVHDVILLSPGDEPAFLSYEITDQYIIYTVPRLKDYGVVVIE
jgi:hypothetical protein